jgi:hypothetical protein
MVGQNRSVMLAYYDKGKPQSNLFLERPASSWLMPHPVQGARANRDGRTGGPPTSFRGSRLGNLAVEEAFIYPRPATV